MYMYEPLKQLVRSARGHREDTASFWERLLSGGTAGALGTTIANPTDGKVACFLFLSFSSFLFVSAGYIDTFYFLA